MVSCWRIIVVSYPWGASVVSICFIKYLLISFFDNNLFDSAKQGYNYWWVLLDWLIGDVISLFCMREVWNAMWLSDGYDFIQDFFINQISVWKIYLLSIHTFSSNGTWLVKKHRSSICTHKIKFTCLKPLDYFSVTVNEILTISIVISSSVCTLPAHGLPRMAASELDCLAAVNCWGGPRLLGKNALETDMRFVWQKLNDAMK